MSTNGIGNAANSGDIATAASDATQRAAMPPETEGKALRAARRRAALKKGGRDTHSRLCIAGACGSRRHSRSLTSGGDVRNYRSPMTAAKPLCYRYVVAHSVACALHCL